MGALGVVVGSIPATAPSGIAARGRTTARSTNVVAARDVSRGRSVSFSPSPGARGRSLSVGGRVNAASSSSSRPRFAGSTRASLRVFADADVFDPAESTSAKGFSAAMQAPSMLKIGRQLGGGGSATLEKVGLSNVTAGQASTAPKLADGGGSGNNGGKVNNGGGGGDGDEGDDDDYYEEGDEEEGDNNFLTTRDPVAESYERDAIKAVMSEWFKTLGDVPAAIRMAIEMGIVSSGQLVRFMSVDVRPSAVRAVSRVAPAAVSRAFVGRLMADPAFLWKLGFEQTVTIAGAVMYEAAHRGDRLKAEWDLAAANILQLSVANAMVVWCLAPTRSFGAVHKFGWQRAMEAIPNNAFDKCGPLRQYTLATRAGSVLAKSGELAALGAITGGVFHGVNQMLVGLHKHNEGADFVPSVPVPDLKTSMLGMGAYLGLSCNLRYQLIGGADRWMTERLTTLASALTATGLGRLANNHFGDMTRLFALGLPIHATAVRRDPAVSKKKTIITKKIVKKKKAKKVEEGAAYA
mmetsp:Transcript_5869/g.14910  ORF Transcript_5869/g.14910 Transcript_5869/m.14910 type:complete len:522 (+) Transcript_5869:208-1773(+)|eukprot:CAMPEP_0197586710 /NCGR_PEP_ID=MMETSP1326-20131121/8581_1 /TAXON_ID=1155430 /ORGANISM="Genus nov. species nov., Strain RCC2288" /LENGTH=521 /DNA_ID=CAMNT_0043151367 /DNA_START=193 /DNA_END=1758 /DNA_ORIENTATION=+